jgi:hypothetical protein
MGRSGSQIARNRATDRLGPIGVHKGEHAGQARNVLDRTGPPGQDTPSEKATDALCSLRPLAREWVCCAIRFPPGLAAQFATVPMRDWHAVMQQAGRLGIALSLSLLPLLLVGRAMRRFARSQAPSRKRGS